MILYHGSTAYHILYCIIHKVAYHPNDKAVLMMTEYMAPAEELRVFIEKIRKRGWFEEILVVPEARFRRSVGQKLTERSEVEEIENTIAKMNELLLEWYPSGFEQFEDIYLAADQWSVGVYLLSHKIPYYYMEDASGLLGDEGRYLKLVQETNPQNYLLCEYLQGAGRNPVVKGKLCDLNNQPEGFYDEKAIDYSIYKTMCQLEEETRMQIVTLYGGQMLSMPENQRTTVFLTQYFNNLKIRDVAIQRKMTELLVDYFAKDSHLIIKPHPKDRYIPYETIFSGCTVVQRAIPSELLPFMLPGEAEQVITPNSTSIGGMRHSCRDVYLFGEEVEVHYERLHLYYVAARILEAVYCGQKVCYPNANALFLQNFLKQLPVDSLQQTCCRERLWVDAGRGYQLLDENAEQFATEDSIIFLEVEDHDTLFWIPWIRKEYLVCINVTVQESRGSRTHRIWFYSKEKKLRKQVMQMTLDKNLENAQVQLKVRPSEVTENMVLEGKLRAMEYAMQKKENEGTDQVLRQAAELIEQYKEEKWMREKMLMREGVLPVS